MHVVFVLPPTETYSREWSGAIATITRYLAEELHRAGVLVTVVTPDDAGHMHPFGEVIRLPFGPARPRARLLRKADAAWARLRRWTWPDYRLYWRAVRRALGSLSEPADVVVLANDPLTADRLARLGTPQAVLWLHNYLAGPESAPLARLSDAVRIVAVSESVAEWTRAQLPPGHPITVIHSGVDRKLFHPREDWRAALDPVRVVCHGRIDPNKGHEAAAAAVEQLRSEGLPVTLTVIGEVRTFGFSRAEEDAYRDRLDQLIARAEGTHRGWLPHDQLAQQLRDHDVACVLSRVHEPFGLVNLEAMASGCAIVTTGTGGILEAVGDGAAIVPPDSPIEVAKVLRTWVADRSLLADRKQAALDRSEDLTWAASATSFLTLVTG